jgi:hypothetical protein
MIQVYFASAGRLVADHVCDSIEAANAWLEIQFNKYAKGSAVVRSGNQVIARHFRKVTSR